MKTFLTIFFFFLFFTMIYTQKRDYVWLFGYANWATDPNWGGAVIDFNFNPPDIFPEYKEMNFERTSASICDTAGNLVLYTNGIYIANYLHQKIPGSDTLNPGALYNDNKLFGYPVTQGAIILPSPEEDSTYYVFHETGEYPNVNLNIHCSGLYYTLVDMKMNGGAGGVLEKRVPVVQDTLMWGKFSAVKHANGQDWWLIVPEHSTNRFYSILLDTSGVHVKGIQAIGTPAHPWEGVGQAAFSPDGSKFARYNAISIEHGADLDVYDFDRCTGLLSNPLHLTIKDSTVCGGVAFSPNSRFMYVSSTFYLYQFDMQADDVFASKDTVAVFDGYTNPFYTVFWLAQLAPNGKIYIIPKTNVKALHIIHQPDEPGDACEVEQHAIHLPTYNAFTMPNFPNYRLGAMPGNPCDTTTTVTAEIEVSGVGLSVFPNPAHTVIHLETGLYGLENSIFSLTDLTGRKVYEWKLQDGRQLQTIPLEGIMDGIYFWQVKTGTEILKAGKIRIMR